MPPKTPTVRKKIVKTTTVPKATAAIPSETAIPSATNAQTTVSPPPPEPTSEKATTSPKLTSPEFPTTITASPETAPALETKKTPKTKIAVSRKAVVRRTPATPKSSSRIVGTAAEKNTSPDTSSAAAAKAPDAASDANTIMSSGVAAGTGASMQTAANALEGASDHQKSGAPNSVDETSSVAGTNSTGEAASAASNGSAENAAKISKPKTTIKVVKKIVKRKKIIRKPVGAAAQLPPKEEEKAESNPNPNPQRQQQPEENGIPDLNSPPSPLYESLASSKMAEPVSVPPATEELIHDTHIADNETEKGDSNQALENESKKIFFNQAVENEPVKGILSATQDDEAMISERRRRRKTEVFIGGLDKDAKEEDLRKVFEKVGKIAEIRLMMNSQTGKNKGYAFLRYASAADAKRAVTELAKVEVRGKQCGVAAAEGNDTIFLGNIDKKWKKEDVIKLLQEIGIENIDIVTVMTDPNDPSRNRGFAFIELETNRDAQNAYKKLQKKNVFGKDRHITVSWAEPLNDPDEEEMQKVKSVYADGIPSSWDEDKARTHFKQFGEIERVVLARNLQSAKRKDFAFINYKTRDSALACIESLNKEGLLDEGTKVNLKVSLAKPVPKGKKVKPGSKPSNKDHTKEKPKLVRSQTNVSIPSIKGKNVGVVTGSVGGNQKSSTQELIQVLREQAAWKQGQVGLVRGSTSHAYHDHMHDLPGGKRPYSSLGDDTSYLDPRGYSRARVDNTYPVASSSYGTSAYGMSGTSSLQYQQRPGASYTSGSTYGTTERFTALQMRDGSASYGGGVYPRY